MEELLICVFKHKDEPLFKIYDFEEAFYCELVHDVEWDKFTGLEKMVIGEAFKLPKHFSTVEDLRQATKYYTGDWHFVWEGYLYA